MMSLKSAARRGGIASLAALSALALASCSSGQITQTSSKVSAVDGASADSEDGAVAVRDVYVVMDEQGDAALKFTAVNQDASMTDHTLESVEVDGQELQSDALPATLQTNCSLVVDSQSGLDTIPQFDEGCITYGTSSLENEDYAFGGNLPVTFTFDNGTVEVIATVSEYHQEAGELHRGDLTDSESDNEPSLGEGH